MNNKRQLIFVKIGGSFITYKDKPFTIDYRALESLAKILKKVIEHDGIRILLGHGGGSFAHPVVEMFKKSSDRVKAIVYCQKATRHLNKIILDYLVDEGIPVVQAQTSMVICCSDELRVNIEPIVNALNNNLIPVIYGECIHDKNNVYTVYSTEKIFKVLIENNLQPNRIVFLERVPGVYNKDPFLYKDAVLIKEINRRNIDLIKEGLGGSKGIDVTGGMASKILLALEIAKKYRIPSIVVSGFNIEDSVKAIISGNPGTGTVIYW